jgi:hypothetical protein
LILDRLRSAVAAVFAEDMSKQFERHLVANSIVGGERRESVEGWSVRFLTSPATVT